jgi:hypothetical protein
MGRALLKPQKETYLNDSTGKRCCKNNPIKILCSGHFQKYQQTQGIFNFLQLLLTFSKP